MLATCLLIVFQLCVIKSFIEQANRDLREFTAGIDQVGTNTVLFVVIHSQEKGRTDPMRHAGDYYCLRSGNINLSMPFGNVRHSVVRFRDGIDHGKGSFESYGNRALVETIVIWEEMRSTPNVPEGFRQRFHAGRLTIMQKL